jgi:SNF2 family DNA or RNA helicase
MERMKFKELAHEYQKNVVNYLIKNPFAGVFLDMGMGKTASVLYAFKWLKQKGLASRMLIIAPKYVALYTWKDELIKWIDLNDLKINIAVGNKRLDAFNNLSDIVIINRENTVWMVKSVSMKTFQVLVVDELSSFKNHESQRFKALSRILHRFKFRWGLTGTPAPNGYLDIYSQMDIISPGLLGSNYYSFRNRYFQEVRPYLWVASKENEFLIQEKLRTCCISLTAQDYLRMPPKIENHISIPMNLKCFKAYKKALEDMVYISKLENLDLDKNLTIKLQQLASGFIYNKDKKFEIVHTLMIDKLEEIVDCTEGNILLFYNFQAEKEIIKSKFSIAQELKSSDDFENWNKGKIKLAICHPVSVGYGMNLQSGGNNIIWYGYNWAADTNLQANARLYRQGQENGVVINYLYVEGTIHNRIYDVLQGKIAKQDMLIESVKYVKYILTRTNKK